MKLSTAARNALANALTTLIDTASPPGHLYIRSSSPPANVSDADAGTLLATLTLSSTAFGAASAGVITAAAITSDTNTPASGTAAHFRIKDGAGTTHVQGTVSATSGDLVFNSVTFASGGVAAVSELIITVPVGS